MNHETRSVSLPSSLCEAAEQKFGAHFDGLQELLTFVLRELMCEDSAAMDQTEQRMIEERLKDLGYA